MWRATATVTVTDLNSDGIVEWGVHNVIPIILLIIGIGMISSSRKGRMSENAGTITNVMMGMCLIAGAAFMFGFAGQITNVVFGG